jgi:hypothetical protein
MKASTWTAAATLVGAVLVGCTASDEPGGTSDNPSPKTATTSPRAAGDSPKTAEPTPSPSRMPTNPTSRDIPSNALGKDGKTPITCADWSGLSNDRQRSLVFSALVQSLVVPVTDSKVKKAQQMVDSDCRNEPDSAAYVVALRAAMSVEGSG